MQIAILNSSRIIPKIRQILVLRLKMTEVIRPYQLTLQSGLGAEVHGVDLNGTISNSVIDRIKQDVTQYKLVIFRNQKPISGHRQVEISQWFGQLESTFYKHPKSPHPDVFRVSNLESEGCTGVGRTGWHIDGSFQPEPFSYSLYYMHHVPDNGDTGRFVVLLQTRINPNQSNSITHTLLN